MSRHKYHNFDVQIHRSESGYYAKAQSAVGGETSCEFNIPFSADKLEVLLSKLGPVRRLRDFHLPSCTDSSFGAAKTLGGQLFNCAFGDHIGKALDRSIQSAEQNGERLRIRLRLTEVPELASLPWEYLYDGQSNRFLALSYKTSIVRYLDIPQRVLPLAVKSPLRVLVMASSPIGYDPLNVKKEWSNLQKAFNRLPNNLVETELLEKASLSSLRERLSQGDQFHVFHYIGHGGYDLRTNTSVLVMEDENHHANFVDGQRLGYVLHNHNSLRMAVLNSCEGAVASLHDVFTGVAQNLIRQELPSVIAMQFEITDTAAVTLAKAFYEALARGNPVDTAIAEARLAIFAEDNNVEWGTPVLYLRSDDGQLFNIDTALLPRVEPEPPTPVPTSSIPIDSGKLPRLPPTGTLSSSSPFYIERAKEREALEIVRDVGITLTIQSSGQTGASSLLRRLMEEAKQAGKQVAHLNFQQAFENRDLVSSEDFHRRFCVVLANRLKKEDRLTEHWEQFKSLSIADRCTGYLQSLLRSMGQRSLLLAMDEVDRLIDADFRSSFFGMLRSWHSERADDELFERLDLVIVTSLEPNQLIDDPNQSPFNIGEVIKLNDFTPHEAALLNSAYGSPLTANQIKQLMSIIGGHPNLWQLALHQIRKSNIGFDQLVKEAKKDSGPFGRHLSSWHDFLQQNEDLREGLKAILSGRRYEWKAFLKLRKLGLVQREEKVVLVRCNLYDQYFREHFNV